MRMTDGARPLALGLLAAVAGTAALGVAVLAAAGAHVCHHHVLAHAPALMTGMPMPAADAEAAEGLCPVLIYAAALAAGLCLLSLLALARARAKNPAILATLARLVAAQRLAPLTAAVGLAGALPLTAILALDGGLTALSGLPALAALAALIAGALLTALGLAGAARTVVALTERLVVALAAVLRLLAPGADAPWALVPESVLVAAGARLARRRPSRAPPVRH
ncbi:MAG TPA: hypothetical protein VGX96_10170 [Candidatus Elarobacter sp.]|jgi:hypothetical protein|nr:hypothetical protein [Candidatus Elarobacter sp.]